MPERERIVVAGAGFAGVRVAKGLQEDFDVTIVAPTDRFVYLPMIHEVLSETSPPGEVTLELGDLLPEAEHVYGRVTRLDGDEVLTSGGDVLAFDKLVVAVGAEVNDFGVPGVREHALPFYSVGDALRANAQLKQAASRLERDEALTVRIVGASFTGVEVAGEVADLLDELDVDRDIVLHEAMDTIFGHQSKEFRQAVHEGLEQRGLTLRTGQMVKEVQEDGLIVEDGEAVDTLPADVVFWAAGVRPRTVPGVTHEVQATLQSWDREDVYVVGDAARFPDRDVPKLAQTAEDQAKTAVHNIENPEAPRSYEPRVKGLIVSIGEKYAVAEKTDGPVFKGRVPWHIKRNLYKAKMKLW